MESPCECGTETPGSIYLAVNSLVRQIDGQADRQIDRLIDICEEKWFQEDYEQNQ